MSLEALFRAKMVAGKVSWQERPQGSKGKSYPGNRSLGHNQVQWQGPCGLWEDCGESLHHGQGSSTQGNLVPVGLGI